MGRQTPILLFLPSGHKAFLRLNFTGTLSHGKAPRRKGVFQVREIGHRIACFEAFVVQGKALDDVLLQSLGGPDAELGTLVGRDSVTDRDDHIQVVVIWGFLLKSGNSEFLHHSRFNRLAFGKNVFNVLIDG